MTGRDFGISTRDPTYPGRGRGVKGHTVLGKNISFETRINVSNNYFGKLKFPHTHLRFIYNVDRFARFGKIRSIPRLVFYKNEFFSKTKKTNEKIRNPNTLRERNINSEPIYVRNSFSSPFSPAISTSAVHARRTSGTGKQAHFAPISYNCAEPKRVFIERFGRMYAPISIIVF